MQASDTAKPATARHGEPASNFEQLEQELVENNSALDLQAQHLKARFGFATETAAVIAALAWSLAR
jgi:regulator of replication initiation timing